MTEQASRQRISSSKRSDRYRHDMEKAKVMKRELLLLKQQNSQASLCREEEDINIALQGLEEADKYKGRKEEALNLYELSIELLLKILRSSQLNKDLITSRVTTALSEAEQLKKCIATTTEKKNEGNNNNTSYPKMVSLLTSAISGLDASLSSSLSFRNNNKKKKKKHSLSPTNATTASATTKKPSVTTTTHSVSRQSSFRKNNNLNRTNSSSPSLQQQQQSRQHQVFDTTNDKEINKEKDNKSDDPLVRLVKCDLYIPSNELQKTKWCDVAGLDRAKQSLQESAILPLIRPDLFTGLRKPQNILLYGPPGTGKTMLVKAVAHESQCLLFACSPSTLTSKWHGEGEKIVRTLFKIAKSAAPSLIFIDEMDSLLSSRMNGGEHEASRRFKTEFMVQMDGVSSENSTTHNDTTTNTKNVLVVGCTNCPWDVDDAVLRRFPRRISVPLPDIKARQVLFRNLLKKAGKHSVTSAQATSILKSLEGYSGSDMSAVASEASFGPIRSLQLTELQKIKEQQLRPISKKDFDNAMKQSTKSVSQQLLKRYDEWEKQNQRL